MNSHSPTDGARDKLGIRTLHHVSISVTDLDRAKRFYGGALGLEEIARPGAGAPRGERDPAGNVIELNAERSG